MHMQHDEAGFKRKAKKSLTSVLTERVPPLLAPMTASHAEALRRCGPPFFCITAQSMLRALSP